MMAVADGGGGHRGEVRPDVRLGHGGGRDQLARADARLPALLLLLGAQREEVGRQMSLVEGQAQPGAAGGGVASSSPRIRVEAEVFDAPTGVPLGDVHAQGAGGVGGGEQLPGHDPCLFPVQERGQDLLLHEGANTRANWSCSSANNARLMAADSTDRSVAGGRSRRSRDARNERSSFL
jgi:hypothetical protein